MMSRKKSCVNYEVLMFEYLNTEDYIKVLTTVLYRFRFYNNF